MKIISSAKPPWTWQLAKPGQMEAIAAAEKGEQSKIPDTDVM